MILELLELKFLLKKKRRPNYLSPAVFAQQKRHWVRPEAHMLYLFHLCPTYQEREQIRFLLQIYELTINTMRWCFVSWSYTTAFSQKLESRIVNEVNT